MQPSDLREAVEGCPLLVRLCPAQTRASTAGSGEYAEKLTADRSPPRPARDCSLKAGDQDERNGIAGCREPAEALKVVVIVVECLLNQPPVELARRGLPGRRSRRRVRR